MCEKSLTNKSSLRRHVKTIHDKEFTNYSCENCQIIISRKDNYERHKIYCENKKVHACQKCDKKFIFPKALESHLKLHWAEDVSFFPIQNDDSNCSPSVKNLSTVDTINVFNQKELLEKMKKLKPGHLHMIGRPGAGKTTLISKLEQEKKVFNIKPEKSRLGSVDFLVPLLSLIHI